MSRPRSQIIRVDVRQDQHAGWVHLDDRVDPFGEAQLDGIHSAWRRHGMPSRLTTAKRWPGRAKR